ncbi:MAG: twin-arginine translocation signal domain-containing protein, partial [Gammaproteobacteria bacterium]|nr:twin-arginine translocation signal domain-containing protein [Gammaproteobacteria bacterium]
MKLTRRDFVKSNAIAAAASVAGITLPAAKTALAAEEDADIRWDKAACRYCGTGCSVLMGVKDGKV